MIYHNYKGRKYPVEEVVLHTAATPGDWWHGKTIDRIVAEIDGWHKARKWKGIGYHRVGHPNGPVGQGRSLWEIGAHVQGHNVGTLGYCLIPVNDHKGIKEFDDYFTKEQEKALKAWLKELQEYTTIKRVTGHNEFAKKECPGFTVRTEDWI